MKPELTSKIKTSQYRGIRFVPKLRVWTCSFVYNRKNYYLCSSSDELACACLRHRVLELIKGRGALPESRFEALVDPFFNERHGDGEMAMDAFYRHQWFRDKSRERSDKLRDALRKANEKSFYDKHGCARNAINALNELFEEYKTSAEVQITALLKQIKILEEKTGFKVGD